MSRLRIAGLALTALFAVGMFTSAARAQSASAGGEEGVAAAEPYPNMPSIPPIGVRTGKYFDVPASAQGPAVDPAKGYRLEDFGGGLYMITDNQIQSMFLVYDRGVVVMDAPQSYAGKIPQAIKEVAGDKRITHLIYSHSHADHIGGAKALGDVQVIIAQNETLRLLKRDADPNRPLPTVTFADKYTLHVGGQVLELTYLGPGHAPGNIFIYAPKQRVLMVIDTVFPGWMPWRRFAVSQDVFDEFARVEDVRKMDWDTVVGGHVTRVAIIGRCRTTTSTGLPRNVLTLLRTSGRPNSRATTFSSGTSVIRWSKRFASISWQQFATTQCTEKGVRHLVETSLSPI